MSCRRGVPDRCSRLNSLAEKVRELWERCANAIKSINGINPDGANNFDILPGAGIQVNPRANGIEIVATGAAPEGMIETINNEGPDADGNFSISAGTGIQINAGTNSIEIENTSQGAIYTGVSPIEVSADNEISLAGWTKVPTNTNDWSFLVENNVTKYEILISFVSNQGELKYIPKGTSTSKYIIVNKTQSTYVYSMYIALNRIFSNGSGTIYDSFLNGILSFAVSGSGINEVLTYTHLTSAEYYGIGTPRTDITAYYR